MEEPLPNLTLKWNMLEISVEQGDITKAVADAFVIPCDPLLECSSGAVQAVVRAGGSFLMDSVAIQSMELPDLQHGQSIALNAGNLDAWFVILVCPRKNTLVDLRECYKRGLAMARDINATTVALPGFGTGNMGTPAEVSANAAFSAVFDSGLNLSSIKSVRIVDANRDVISGFQLCLKGWAKKLDNAKLIRENQGDSERFGAGNDENDGRRSIDRFIRIIPSPSSYDFVCEGNYKGNMEADDVCAICYDILFRDTETQAVVQLKKCGHAFHRLCLEESFSRLQERCPICKRWYSAPRGNQPSGSTMTVTQHAGVVPGFPEADGYFCIEYNLPGGVQTFEHPRPGLRFSGVRRYGYLPATCEGTKILELFKLAFSSRLMFTVGDCETGRRNVVIFNGIHNKTSLEGGPQNYGFPDPDYFDRVRRELAAVGITEQLLETLRDC